MNRTLCLLGVVLVLAAAVVAAPAGGDEHAECKARLANYTATCKTDLKVTDAEVEAMMKPAPYPEKTKCLINCIAENFMVMKDGKLIEAAMLAMINDPKKPAPRRDQELLIFNKCKGLVGKDNCDTAAVIFGCVMENIAKGGPMVKS